MLVWHYHLRWLTKEKDRQQDCQDGAARNIKSGGGAGFLKAIGVRAEESPRRKGLWKLVVHNKKSGTIICPILYWTDADVWAFIKNNDMPYCSLYDEGYTRLGCIGCPMAGSKKQQRDFARWPRYEHLWRKGFQLFWDTWKGVPRRDGGKRHIEKFSSVDELWDWWISGKASSDTTEPDCQIWMW